MGNNSILIGYYICKYRKCPEYLRNISEGILSASDCLCTHEPQITCCHGWKPNGDKKEYIESIALSDEQYITMSNEICAYGSNRRTPVLSIVFLVALKR